jgi:hypothetical protein
MSIVAYCVQLLEFELTTSVNESKRGNGRNSNKLLRAEHESIWHISSLIGTGATEQCPESSEIP